MTNGQGETGKESVGVERGREGERKKKRKKKIRASMTPAASSLLVIRRRAGRMDITAIIVYTPSWADGADCSLDVKNCTLHTCPCITSSIEGKMARELGNCMCSSHLGGIIKTRIWIHYHCARSRFIPAHDLKSLYKASYLDTYNMFWSGG